MHKHLIYILLFCFLIISGQSRAADPVKMKCVVVNADGSITFYWENPIDLSDFNKFIFYHSNNGINFSKLDSSSVSTTNFYTHSTTAGNSSQKFYFVDIVSQSGISTTSDTLGSIFFQLDNNDPDFNMADLYWTKVSEPPPDGSNGQYQIYWDYPDGSWKLINSSTSDNYSFDINVCEDSINFKIELENSFCNSVSNIRGNWFRDVEYPQIIDFDSISVNDFETILGWSPSQSQDVVGYILYRNQSGTWQEFDTVIGINNTLYTDTVFSPCEISKEYAIAAIDSCGNKSEGSFLQPQKPIFIYEIGYNVCEKQDTLVWEQYENSFPEIDNYFVWRSTNGGNFEKIATLGSNPNPEPPESINNNQMWYIDEGINPGNTYQYYVQAAFGNRTSSSCIKEIVSYSYKVPLHLYLANADVFPENQIQLSLDVDENVFSCTWEIYRSEEGNPQIDLVSSINFNDLQSNPLVYNDADADPETSPYQYYAIVKDSCEIKVIESNILKTIHLTGSKVDKQTNLLEWNEFEGWETNVEKYYIYRISSMENGSIPFDSVDAFTFSYEDKIDESMATNGKFTYWVQAKQIEGGQYDYKAYSNSNHIDLFLESNIFFPTAFKPSSTISTNSEFKPIFNFFSGSNYSFMIYNRWGQIIYETNEVDKGWNGSYKNKKQSSGLYIYRLTYQNVYGQNIERKGSFMLLN
ncbi:MAG: hypothetical protein C0595_06245 [Marinilabiliales bacterium]|nr:MAG: hypothetical protein C0595_06245 [Marinilabiliales bacterium]